MDKKLLEVDRQFITSKNFQNLYQLEPGAVSSRWLLVCACSVLMTSQWEHGWKHSKHVVRACNRDLGRSTPTQWAPGESHRRTTLNHKAFSSQTVNTQWHIGANVPYSTFYATYIGLAPTPALNVMIYCQKWHGCPTVIEKLQLMGSITEP